MNKRYLKYFGKNVTRTIYVIGSGLCCFGIFCILFSNPFIGMICAVIGVSIFFLTSHKQVSDKMIDELVEKSVSEYKSDHLCDLQAGKTTLDGDKFSLFSGFIRDNGEVRFKRGRDEKLRTSRYFVTAVYVEKKSFAIHTTVYDMISGDKTSEFACSINATDIEFSRESLDFPQRLHKCTLKTLHGDEEKTLLFYLPADALADKLIERIEDINADA